MEKLRTRLFVVGLVLMGSVGVGLLGRGSFGQALAAPPASEVGRYQLIPVGNSNVPDLYLLDTKTGHCWRQSSPGAAWVEESPNSLKTR